MIVFWVDKVGREILVVFFWDSWVRFFHSPATRKITQKLVMTNRFLSIVLRKKYLGENLNIFEESRKIGIFGRDIYSQEVRASKLGCVENFGS